MVKLRWLKIWKTRKIGEISNVAEKSAGNFVSQGYAEVVEEEKTIKKDMKKDKKATEIPNQLKDANFVRVRLREKRAFEKGWQEKPYTYSEISNFFPKENYGIICGEDIRVLDDDTNDKRLIKLFLKTFGETFRVRDHLYFSFDNKHSKKIILFDENEHLGEIQGERTYVVGPLSIHPSGEKYSIKNDLDIKEISYDKFMEMFGPFFKSKGIVNNNLIEELDDEDKKIIDKIKEQWIEGDRQNLAMGLAGYLRKEKGFGFKHALSVVKQICLETEDKDVDERSRAVKETYMKDESQIKGISTFIERDIEFDKSIKEKYMEFIIKKQYNEASELLVNEVMKSNNIYTIQNDDKPEIFIYSNGIYVPEGKTIIEQQLRGMIGETFNVRITNEVVTKIKADTYIEAEDFFMSNEKYEVAVENGILNVQTLDLIPFTPDKIFFSKMPVKYVPGGICEKIDQFLTDVLASNDDKDVFYEMVGFGLVKDYFMEKAIMMVGNGRNGKGKSLDLIKRLVGAYNCSSVALDSLKHDSIFVDNLRNKMFNMGGDLTSGGLKDTGMFKQLTGRDLISANRKYKNVVQFENYAKMMFACNTLPRVYDSSDGFWERWLLLEFPYKFVDKSVYDEVDEKDKKFFKIKNPNIIKEITTENEMSGFLNMALLGLHRLFENKRFSYSIGTEDVKNKWIRKSDSFMAFCLDHLEENVEGIIRKSDLRKVYLKYCQKHKAKGVSDKSLKATLQEYFGVIDEYVIAQGFHNQEWCWMGVKYK